MQFLGIEAIEISFEMRILLEIQIKYRFRAIREREREGERRGWRVQAKGCLFGRAGDFDGWL